MSSWWRHGFWNTLDHALTRVLDAAVSILLIRGLATEQFSKIGLAQAAAAPALILFFSPSGALYRDFAKWKKEGPARLAARLRALRLYGLGLGALALLISAAVAWGFPGEGAMGDRFYALLWAFLLLIGIHLSGADREFLRLELDLRALNAINLYQKATLLSGVAYAIFACEGRLEALALAAAFSMGTTALLATLRVRARLGGVRPDPKAPSTGRILREAIGGYSMWAHLSGVIQNGVLSMDLLALGAFRLPAQTTGLYSAALKLANFGFAAPTALANLFSIWVGRREPGDKKDGREEAELRRLSLALLAACAAQSVVIVLLAPWAVAWLSHGRWSAEEQTQVVTWLAWLLAGVSCLASTFLLSSWLSLRGQIRAMLFRVYVPWAGCAAGIYGAAAHFGGASGAAMANVPVALLLAGLLLLEKRRVCP